MWNDTDTPIAYFISFRTYGTWLHGDERGSIDKFNNVYRTPYVGPNKKWLEHNQKLLKSPPFKLNAKARNVIDSAVREVCTHRGWCIHALNVRTNHVHTVVTAHSHPSQAVLNAFKAYGTRHLRENDCWNYDHSPWADKGSRRRIWNERGLQAAIDYVENGQGGPLPDFD
ncbi:MAG TPA: transposase [Pyrinomonadaceae bacterium]|nr:transposase [Pyrinomonadaceae bacterium]